MSISSQAPGAADAAHITGKAYDSKKHSPPPSSKVISPAQ